MLCSATRPAVRDRDRHDGLLGQLGQLARLALQHQQLARLALRPAAEPSGELETLGELLRPPTSLGWQSLKAEPAGKSGGEFRGSAHGAPELARAEMAATDALGMTY